MTTPHLLTWTAALAGEGTELTEIVLRAWIYPDDSCYMSWPALLPCLHPTRAGKERSGKDSVRALVTRGEAPGQKSREVLTLSLPCFYLLLVIESRTFDKLVMRARFEAMLRTSLHRLLPADAWTQDSLRELACTSAHHCPHRLQAAGMCAHLELALREAAKAGPHLPATVQALLVSLHSSDCPACDRCLVSVLTQLGQYGRDVIRRDGRGEAHDFISCKRHRFHDEDYKQARITRSGTVQRRVTGGSAASRGRESASAFRKWTITDCAKLQRRCWHYFRSCSTVHLREDGARLGAKPARKMVVYIASHATRSGLVGTYCPPMVSERNTPLSFLEP
eukprot:6491722-Amphidinium_carterae.2